MSGRVILQLGCNNIHCDTRGGGPLTSDGQRGKKVHNCVRVCVFLTMFSYALVPLEHTCPVGPLCVCATDCYKSC